MDSEDDDDMTEKAQFVAGNNQEEKFKDMES